MDIQKKSQVPVDSEQTRYAGILQKGAVVGFITVIITFALYVFGLIRPYVPLEDFPVYCRTGARHFMADHGIGGGWSWVHLLGYGDFMNYIGIIILMSITVICYIAIVPILLRKKDWIFAAIVIAEVALLITASSGLLNF